MDVANLHLHTTARRRPSLAALHVQPLPATAIGVARDGRFASEPQLVQGAAESWRANQRWRSPDSLCEHYGNMRFAVSSGVQMTLKDYLEYASRADCDFPMYLVETRFAGEARVLLEDYAPPAGFADELAEIPGTRSPPHWFVGGRRTGSLMHQDTRCSAGWNVCTFGAKRWCMLPPETDVMALGLEPYGEGPACWFADHLPALQAAAADGRLRLFECIQRAGDLVYVPAGWHHAVVNLEVSCAIAHTVITPSTLPAAWPYLRSHWPAFAHSLVDLLRHSRRPELAAALNQAARSDAATVVARGEAALRGSAAASNAVHEHNRLSLNWKPFHPAVRSATPSALPASELATAPPSAPPPPPPSTAASRQGPSAIFVHRSWFDRLVRARPSAAAVLRGEASVAALWAFHRQLAALASTAHAAHADVCLVTSSAAAADADDAADGDDAADDADADANADADARTTVATGQATVERTDPVAEAGWAAEATGLLARHGLPLAGAVRAGGEEAWAAARGVMHIAVVRATADPRQQALADVWAHAGLPTCRVEPRITPSCGVALYATGPCQAGDVLLTLPLSLCLTSFDAPAAAAAMLPGGDDFGRLLLALLRLIDEHGGVQGGGGGEDELQGKPHAPHSKSEGGDEGGSEAAGDEGGSEAAGELVRSGGGGRGNGGGGGGARPQSERIIDGAGSGQQGEHGGRGEGFKRRAALARYFRTLFTIEDAETSMMALWDGDGPAARRAAHCVAWQRARRARREMEEEHRALVAANVLRCTARHYMWAKLVLQTRAFSIRGGKALLQGVDLANHRSFGATARVRRCVSGAEAEAEADGGVEEMAIVAEYALDADDEVSICYDPDADHLDVFERYGFFDATSVVHTAEVVVPRDMLWGGGGASGGVSSSASSGASGSASGGASGGEPWREALIAAQAGLGCDADFTAWWLPDVALDACPLYAALRATVVSREELEHADGDPADRLRQPVAREAVARERLARILEWHLAGYPCTVESAELELQGGVLSATEEAATRLVLFEMRLLEQHLRALGRSAVN